MTPSNTQVTHHGARDMPVDGGKEQFFCSDIHTVFGCCALEVNKACRSKEQNDKMAQAKLEQWLEDRAKRHQCSLVSDQNPMGLLPSRGMRTKAEVS